MLANRPEYFEIAWGAQRAGTYWTPVNWHLTAEEAAYIVADSGATVLFASPETAEVAARMPGVRVFVTGGEPPGPARRDRATRRRSRACRPSRSSPGSDDGAEVEGSTVFYSSGTTGRPKGIMRAAEFPPFGAGVPLDLVMRLVFGFGPDSVYLCPGPLYHAAPLGFSMGTHRAGGTVVLMDRFDPAGCLRAIEAHQVTHAQFVPTHFVRMLRLPDPERRALRPVHPADRHPRRRPVPGRREAGDDRLVRPGDLGVLRRQRGQRDDRDRHRGVAVAPRLGRPRHLRQPCTSSTRTAPSSRPGRTG